LRKGKEICAHVEKSRHGVLHYMLIFKPTKSGPLCIEDKYDKEIGIISTAKGQDMKMMKMIMNGVKKKREKKTIPPFVSSVLCERKLVFWERNGDRYAEKRRGVKTGWLV